MRKFTTLLVVALFSQLVLAQPKPKPARPAPAPKYPTWPDASGLHNVAQTDLGATAIASGSPVNKDWPGMNSIQPEANLRANGTLFGNPMVKGRVDIKLVVPVDIKAIEVVGLDYHGTRQPKAIDVFVDGKLVKQQELPENPGKPFRFDVDAKGQMVGIVITDEHPIRTNLPKNETGKAYGGWKKLRVLSPTDILPLMKAPDGYVVNQVKDFIEPTVGAASGEKVQVYGEPRQAQGHPNTIWDAEDIKHYKQMLESSAELQKQYAHLKTAMDARITKEVGVPEPRKDEQGNYIHVSDREVGKTHNQLGLDIANLGAVYVLSGEEKYAEFAKKILLAYADAFPNYGVGARPGFTHDPSKVFDQRLGDSTWLIQVARGYDLIYNSPSITPEERKHIQDDLIRASARFILQNSAMLRGPTNWSAIATCAVLISGYACDDDELVQTALYGVKGTKEKPTGGVFFHFSEKCIGEDGLWAEGSTGYQFMAMEALVAEAEILWHHGVDMYRYRDAALKRLFDSPIRYAYPNLVTPAIHDGGGSPIIGYESHLWEFGYRRYGDPSYLLILNQVQMNLGAQFQKFPVSILYDREQNTTPPIEWKSVNFFDVGFGILRVTDERGTNSLLMDYGPNRSHGHPDKLNIDLYAFGDRFIPDPGSIWYEQPLYRQWYRTSVAHNTLVVDEQDQRDSDAFHLVYGSADTFGIQRAWTDQPYSGVMMDRAVFMTSDYMADVFGAFSRLPHKMDLAWHFLGKMSTSVPLQPMEEKFVVNGYNALENMKSARTSDAYTMDFKAKNGLGRFVAGGGTDTQIIVGDGYMGRERPPTVLQRRETNATVFGNAVDVSNGSQPFVKSVNTDGGLEKGFALMRVETIKGTDLCFVAYRPGTHDAGGLTTDAQQAFVVSEDSQVKAMYLGGGTRLKSGDMTLHRNEPGLAYIEKTVTGSYFVGNPSPTSAVITVSADALQGMQIHLLNAQGERSSIVRAQPGKDGIALQLAPTGRVEFANAGTASPKEHKQAIIKKRQEEAEAAKVKAAEEAQSRSQARVAEAKAKPAPANTTIVVQAEDKTSQGEGEATVATNKVAAVGTSLSQWNGNGHWIEWTVEVPADGYYNLSACYCVQSANASREISINGEVQEPAAPLTLPVTGGFSNSSDDWKLATAIDSSSSQPLLLKFKAGQNTLRLTNIDGNAANVDYLLITSPDVNPSRLK